MWPTGEWVDFGYGVHVGCYRKQSVAAIIELPDFLGGIRETAKRINVGRRAFTAFLLAAAVIISPVSAADIERWAAVALEDWGRTVRTGWRKSYGAAWNFPTEAEAARAALRECEKRTRQGCFVSDTSRRRCLAVLQRGSGGEYDEMRNAVLGDRIAFSIETAEDVKREFEVVRRFHHTFNLQLEMYHCPITGETWNRKGPQ